MEYNYQQIINGFTSEVSTQYILRLPDNAWIPNNPENTDWQAYLAWLAEGNTPISPEGN